ncbi:hypothetical protein Emtol_3655 [Emticicia oligotrophica DSM 17448]|uniref:Uncharacterized protein n=1 Tax=Emticicia oligotrophica (strain DSM 17448 / CIP 109782 / MTCC 6937 / GPTSA100-15) TaxID=929562 RepID=A0ABM5N5M6_EMTOG|nr:MULTISPECIES: DUF6580 family putative transport protein [Emticicia]AFK04781.1 hypothetical protein Emtol_3655 [Emticicia oligotrophica DSM 17448]
MNITRFSTLLAIVVLAALSRFLPHPFNFTPIAAIALFGGAYFTKRWQALFLPMAAMFLSDVILEITTGFGFHSGMPMVYGAFALVSVIGMIAIKKVSPVEVVGASLASSLIFFLITNCAYLYPVPEINDPTMISYPHSIEGLMASYTAGLPFLKNQILGDLFFSTVLFGGFAFLQRRFDALKMA